MPFIRSHAPYVPPPAPSGWDVTPAPTFQQGAAGTYNVAATGPAGYTAGGVYDVDASGFALPTGISLSEAGVLTDGGAAPATANNVVFGYTEPGALPTLTLLTALAGTNTLPYIGTVYPAEGAVPSGRTIVSPDDSNLRASILSTWPDGSAQVAVVAGSVALTGGVAKPIRLRQGAAPGGTNLTTAAITAALTSITVDFGGGAQTLSSFAAPDLIWWSSPQVICARYRLACGVGALEAIIDIHAFSLGRLWIEIVIENCNIDSSSPSIPANQTYVSKTVKVRPAGSGSDTTIATVSSPTNGQTFLAPTDGSGTMTWGLTGHEALRSWYCSTWIDGTTVGGASDPGVEVTHDTTYLRSHPLFMRYAASSTFNHLATYGSDTYTPFSHQRHAPSNMGGTGDNKWIGHFPKWEQHYLQSGDRNARKAVIASTLAVLTFAVNYRDTTTRLVPSFTQIGSKSRNASTWPQASNGSSDPAVWEVAHQPAAGLIGFLCRPSPCFIEIAQKVALWSCSWTTPTTFASKFYQQRGRTWTFRNLAHAAFLTPTTISGAGGTNMSAWRTSAKSKLAIDVGGFDQFRTASGNYLEVMVDGDAGSYVDHCPNSGVSSEGVGFQNSLWMHWFTVMVLHQVHRAKVLTGADQDALNVLADWAGKTIVRYINEASGHEWRYIRHMTTCGQANYNAANPGVGAWGGGLYQGATMDQLTTWDAMQAWWMSDAAQSISIWKVIGDSTANVRDYANASWASDTVANTGLNYATWFWSGLVAAVERDIPGAAAAWAKVNTLSGLSTWLAGFSSDPRQGFYPRNV